MKALRSFTVRAKLPSTLAPLHDLAMNLRWAWDAKTRALALRLVDNVRIEVDLAGVPLRAQVWRADVGRVRLYLLDADIEENGEEGRLVTDRLYGGGAEHRIRQEILLGIGGVRALEALGEETQVFHTNEGHAGFLGLERIRTLMTGDNLSFA